MNSINSSEHRIIGLDIGIASVGWAVLGENRIVDIGVRCFEKGETSKKGESLNLARRNNRLQRRRLYRRAWRLTKLSRLLKREGLIENSKLFLNSPSFAEPVPNSNRKFVASPWTLRMEGLDRLLTKEEWSRVIYHICKSIFDFSNVSN
jgi:CRISPR-associated endonuclease Csn1